MRTIEKEITLRNWKRFGMEWKIVFPGSFVRTHGVNKSKALEFELSTEKSYSLIESHLAMAQKVELEMETTLARHRKSLTKEHTSFRVPKNFTEDCLAGCGTVDTAESAAPLSWILDEFQFSKMESGRGGVACCNMLGLVNLANGDKAFHELWITFTLIAQYPQNACA